MQFVSGRIFDVAGVEVEGWVNSMDWGVIIHVRGHRIQLILGNLRVSILLMQRANFLWGFLVVFIEVNVFSLCVKVRIVDLRSQDEKSVTLVIESSGGRKSGTELFCRSDERQLQTLHVEGEGEEALSTSSVNVESNVRQVRMGNAD